jgi:hypothetical protein
VSNLRPLDEVPRDVLFYRPCKRCQQGFLYCRGREPGRRYCGEECAAAATEERVKKARQTYRDSPEGQEQHRDEEIERRKRRRLERVGDRRLEPAHGELQIVSAAAPFERAVEEKRDEEPGTDRQLEWLLVVWPSLLTEAESWLGTEVACPGCARKGIVRRVVGLDDWREEDTS